MIQIGLISSQTLVSVPTDEDETPILDALRPPSAPEDWEAPAWVRLVKLDAPEFNAATHRAEPRLEWFGDRVERQWDVVELAPEEVASKQWDRVDEFWAELTPEEQLAIMDSQVPGIRLLYAQLQMWRGRVDSSDPRVADGLDGLVAVGILTPARRQEIAS